MAIEGESTGWTPAGKSPHDYPMEPRTLAWRAFIDSLLLLAGSPLAALAWFRHGPVAGGADLLALAVLLGAWELKRRMPAIHPAPSKTRLRRLGRLLTNTLISTLTIWYVAVAIRSASLSDNLGVAVMTATGGSFAEMSMPRVQSWVVRFKLRSKRR